MTRVILQASFFDKNFAGHGFLKFPDGNVKTFDPRNSAFTRVEAIDQDGGAITGEYADPQQFLLSRLYSGAVSHSIRLYTRGCTEDYRA